MRIVTGVLRGRTIPSTRVLASIRLTSARLKEAVFSMLGTELADLTFLDLCAGSGQIGLEAASRGARAVLNEPDHRRQAQILRLLRDWRVDGVELRREKAQMLIPLLQEEGRSFDVIYLDPPYEATRHARPLSIELLEQLAASALPVDDGLVLVQHQAELEPPNETGALALLERRSYGNTTLSIYRRQT